MTPEQAKAVLLPRLTRNARAGIQWSDVASAFSASTAAQKAEVVRAIRAGGVKDIARAVRTVMEGYITASANERADQIIADGNIDLTELDEIVR